MKPAVERLEMSLKTIGDIRHVFSQLVGIEFFQRYLVCGV